MKFDSTLKSKRGPIEIKKVNDEEDRLTGEHLLSDKNSKSEHHHYPNILYLSGKNRMYLKEGIWINL